MSASLVQLSPEDEEYIMGMLEERSFANKNRDFDTADYIPDDLTGKLNVSIQDKLKQW